MRRNEGGSPETPRPSKYASTGVHPDVKTHTAEFAMALRDRGVAMSTIMDALKDTSYAPGASTLRMHIAAISGGEAPLSSEKGSGRPGSLTEEQWEIVFGWVLNAEKNVALEDVQRWIRDNLGIEVSLSTVSRTKDKMGLSIRLVSRRGMPLGISRDEYALGYFEFVKRLHDTAFFNIDPKRLICIDFVTNSQRRELETALSLKGGKQPKNGKSLPQYTNSYCVGVAYGEGAELMVLMFTHDPTFDPVGPRCLEVQSWCDANKISRDQIYYEKSSKKYCKEKQSQVVEFERRNRDALRGAHVLVDAGGAFKLDGDQIVAGSARRVEVMPAAQHGELSVLDNKVNAVAKAQWRQLRHNIDHSWDAFLLLVCLERVGQDSITSFWKHNLLLDAPAVTVSAVEDRLAEVNGAPPIRQHLADKYTEAYASWAQDHEEVDPIYEGDIPTGGLNGSYWKLIFSAE